MVSDDILRAQLKKTLDETSFSDLGAKFEGIHRRHMRRADGTLRDTAWYAVIRDEWPAVRAGLEARLAAVR